MNKIYLCLSEDKHFADGFQVYEQIIDEFDKTERFRYGDYISKRRKDFISLKELDIDTLKWQNIEVPYVPTIKDKIKKFFKKNYVWPDKIMIRPEDNSIVICDYGIGHYEVVEYSHKSWITEFSFPVMPKRWCYIRKGENY